MKKIKIKPFLHLSHTSSPVLLHSSTLLSSARPSVFGWRALLDPFALDNHCPVVSIGEVGKP